MGDINSTNVRALLAPHLRNDLNRGFDTITFSYSLTMIPEWEKALESAKTLMSDEGRVIIADFDTYTEEGKSFKDMCIRLWYKQDGVRIEAKTREVIMQKAFTADKFTTTVARFQQKLLG